MLSKLFSKDFFSERPLLLLSGLAVVSSSFTIFRVLTTVRQRDFKVATSYTEYGVSNFNAGEWYTLYEFALFALISTTAAILISARLLKVDKSLAYTTMILQHVILIFLLIVSNALLNVPGVI